MNFLALDLGSNTGWAANTLSGQIISGSYTFKPSRYEGGGMRYVRFRAMLDELQQNMAFDAVYFEEVRRHAGTDAAHVYGGFLATLTAWCEEKQIPYQGVPVGTIKRYATGKGNANKLDMVNAMEKRGHKVNDANEADALALLYFAMNKK